MMRKVTIDGRIYVPVELVIASGIGSARYADVVIRHNGREVVIPNARIYRSKSLHGVFIKIPREVMIEYGIHGLDYVEIVSIKPRG